MKLFSWLKNKLKKKEKNKEQELTSYGLPLEEKEEDESPLDQVKKIGKERVKSAKKSLSTVMPPRPLKFGIFLKLKRILAGILFFIYIITSIMVFPHPFLILFLGTALLLLDYVAKTRRSKWVEA